MIKKLSSLLICILILMPIFFLQPGFVLAKESDISDPDTFSELSARSSAVALFSRMKERAYCTIARLFSNMCELQGAPSVTSAPATAVARRLAPAPFALEMRTSSPLAKQTTIASTTEVVDQSVE